MLFAVQFRGLQHLDVSWNRLSDLVLSSQTLRVLDVSGNCLKQMRLKRLLCLESLYIGNNVIENAEGLESCNQLRIFVAENNKFERFFHSPIPLL